MFLVHNITRSTGGEVLGFAETIQECILMYSHAANRSFKDLVYISAWDHFIRKPQIGRYYGSVLAMPRIEIDEYKEAIKGLMK